MDDLYEYLNSKDIQLKTSGSQAYTHCWHCNEDESKRGRLYINIDPESEHYGAYFCHLCNAKGGLNSIRRHFGDEPIGEANTQNPIIRAATEYYAERLLEHPDAYNYLTEKRGLTPETIQHLQLGWSDNGLLTHLVAQGFTVDEAKSVGLINRFGEDFLRHKITIPYLVYGQPITIRGKEIGGKYMSLPGSKANLYGIDDIRGEETVLVAAGEFDQAILSQLGFPAIGVPGENIWKPEWTEQLADARRIFILFDNDVAGNAGAEKLATLLGPRSRRVELPATEGKKKFDVTECVVGLGKTKEDFDFMLSKAKGGLLVSPAQAYDTWCEYEGNPDRVGLRFNIDPFDRELHQGLLPGQVVTLLARTNVGKTIFSINVLHRMRMLKPDLKVLFISLEQMRNEWFERAYRIHNFYEPGSTTLDTVKYWQDNLFIVDENRINEETLEMCIDQFVYEMGCEPDIVLIDYLGYYARGFKGEEYARVTDAIMGLKGMAKRHKCVMFLPHQANRSNEMGSEVRLDQGRGAGTVEETADLAISLWNPDQRKPEQEGLMSRADQKKELVSKILKARDNGVNSMCLFQSAPLTLAIVPHGDPLYERAVRERQYWVAGDDFKTVINRYLTGDETKKWELV